MFQGIPYEWIDQVNGVEDIIDAATKIYVQSKNNNDLKDISIIIISKAFHVEA